MPFYSPVLSNPAEFEVGLANFFLQHTSASLTINENASPDVPKDLNDSLDKIVPETWKYRHDDEGPDDVSRREAGSGPSSVHDILLFSFCSLAARACILLLHVQLLFFIR
jgi:hypothetical protein